MLVLVSRASLIRCLVTNDLMATVTQHRDGSGGATALVVGLAAGLVVGLVEASAVGGEGGELMDTLGGKSCSYSSQ